MDEFEDCEIDPLTTEEKLISAHEEALELPPWEITKIAQRAMSHLPEDFDVEQIDAVFDVVYEAISESIERLRTQI